jgi:hypothetical protein
MARQPWAMWTRFARCSFACATTPHLFLAQQPDSPSIMLPLVQASLTTGRSQALGRMMHMMPRYSCMGMHLHRRHQRPPCYN